MQSMSINSPIVRLFGIRARSPKSREPSNQFRKMIPTDSSYSLLPKAIDESCAGLHRQRRSIRYSEGYRASAGSVKIQVDAVDGPLYWRAVVARVSRECGPKLLNYIMRLSMPHRINKAFRMAVSDIVNVWDCILYCYVGHVSVKFVNC